MSEVSVSFQTGTFGALGREALLCFYAAHQGPAEGVAHVATAPG